MAKGYTKGKWGKEANYECNDCQYSTLYEAQMQAHVEAGSHVASDPGKQTAATKKEGK